MSRSTCQPEQLETAIRGLAAAGFAGANVTIPHKRAAALLCDEADGDAVNTLVFADGRIRGFNTDKEIVASIDSATVCLIGAGGAAATLLPGLRGEVRQFSRRGEWPPDADGCDLDRQRDTGARRAPRRAARRARRSSSSPTARARRRSSPPRAQRVVRSSTGAKPSSCRARRASSSGRARLRL